MPFGLFEYVRMPFGMRNSGQTFQRLMDKILVGLSYCFVYLDDILIASKDMAQHREHLRAVLSRLRDNGLIHSKKCVFAAASLDFLGHRVSADGVSPLES
jgi:Reverse transcriptase (RNA-dependent DNA polymerase)